MLSIMKIVEAEDTDGMIISLNKAFYSVSHKYIEKCWDNFGFPSFIPIFQIPYAELETKILIDGMVAKGCKVKRGVK